MKPERGTQEFQRMWRGDMLEHRRPAEEAAHASTSARGDATEVPYHWQSSKTNDKCIICPETPHNKNTTLSSLGLLRGQASCSHGQHVALVELLKAKMQRRSICSKINPSLAATFPPPIYLLNLIPGLALNFVLYLLHGSALET